MIKLTKFLTLCLAVLMLAFCLSACETEAAEEECADRFEKIGKNEKIDASVHSTIFVDKKTGVMYLFVDTSYGSGVTVMVDENGNPLIWEGE